eukprot:COSAG02_NODE_13606_length_1373_cov_1.490581_2_plen_182_part_00
MYSSQLLFQFVHHVPVAFALRFYYEESPVRTRTFRPEVAGLIFGNSVVTAINSFRPHSNVQSSDDIMFGLQSICAYNLYIHSLRHTPGVHRRDHALRQVLMRQANSPCTVCTTCTTSNIRDQRRDARDDATSKNGRYRHARRPHDRSAHCPGSQLAHAEQARVLLEARLERIPDCKPVLAG